jgi:hypothetical protein
MAVLRRRPVASKMVVSRAATGTCLSSSALAAAISRTWITPRKFAARLPHGRAPSRTARSMKRPALVPRVCCPGAFAGDYGLACFAGGGVHREDEESARAWPGRNCLGTAISATMSAPSPQCVNRSPGRSPVPTGRRDDDGQWVRHGEYSPEVSACSCQPKRRAPGWHPNPAALAALARVHPEHNELGEAHSRRTQADTPSA